MDANELGRWTRFAAKGGIGKCTAVQDCVAEEPEDLMFLKDDEITVLMQLPGPEDMYLGHCEGVVGRFKGSFVNFHSRLKKPVLTKRSSSAQPISRPSSQNSVTVTGHDAASPIPSSASSPVPRLIRSPTISHTIPASTSAASDVSLAHSTFRRSSITSSAPSPLRPPSVHKRGSINRISIVHVNGAEESSFGSHNRTGSSITEDDPKSHRASTTGGNEGTPSVVQNSRSSIMEEASTQLSESEDLLQESEEHANSTESPDLAQDEASLHDSEPSSRISVALSDGEVGIGLSLLQDFLGGGDDDAASTFSRQSRSQTPDVAAAPNGAIEHSPESTVEGHAAPSVRSSTRSESRYSSSSRGNESTKAKLHPGQINSRETSSPTSMHRSITDSSDFGGEEWEGASDIYDNYRYSRFSMASKVSRFSKGSMHTLASGFEVPPVPAEFQSALSDSRSVELNVDQAIAAESHIRRSVESQPNVDQPRDRSGAVEERGKRVPPPLDLSSSRRDADARKHEILGLEATPHSTGSFLSTPLTPPLFPSTAHAGVASALRQRLEWDRPVQQSNSDFTPKVEDHDTSQRRSGFDIVVEDDAHVSSTDPFPDVSMAEASFDSSHDESIESTSTAEPFPSLLSEKNSSMKSSSTAEPAPPPYSIVAPAANVSADSAAGTSQQHVDPHPTRRPSGTGRPAPHPNGRTSLFLPHPHAPKPAQSPAGPMYGRQPALQSHVMSRPGGPSPGTLIHSLNMVLIARHEGRPGRTTIYGNFERDLASALGPVLVTFSVDPPRPHPTAAATGPRAMGPAVDNTRSGPSPSGQRPLATEEVPLPKQSHTEPGHEAQVPPSKTSPRANFFPQASSPRRRSRSFSGFDKPFAEMFLPERKSRDDGGPVPLSPQRSRSATATPTTPASLPAPHHATVSHASSIVRSVQAPSPLSLAQNNVVAPDSAPAAAPIIESNNSGSVTSSGRATVAPLALQDRVVTRMQSLTQLSTVMNGSGTSSSSKGLSLIISSPMSPRSPPSTAHSFSSAQSPAISPSLFPPVPTHHNQLPGRVNVRDTEPLASSAQSGTVEDHVAGSPPASQTVQLPSNSSFPDETFVPEILSPTLSLHPSETSQDQETIQIKDTDFEMVKPVIPSSPIAASSSESLPRTMASINPNSNDDGSLLRTDSPAPSMWSSASVRRPIHDQVMSDSGQSITRKTSDVEAHRQRELRWMSAMTSVPPSQARKSKKIKKLIHEGVPASVRYLVWAHLTDSKGKRMDSLYRRLCERDKVAAHAEIERDIEQCYSDQAELQDGSLFNVLQAYLSMVPDVHYSQGLTLIAGQLLLQSPEEDAFWTFTTLMDSYLRPYFAQSLTQLDVDALLFSKALESNDSVSAKKTFFEFALPAVDVCKPWFLSAYAGALSADYLHRVWDVFLFEGISFLFRVGLALFSCCRRLILQSTSKESLLATLHRPPADCLPPTPDAFIDLAFSMKLKDEDVRKQRTKLEAQVKRQTQGRALSSIQSSRATPISLPRT